MKKRRHQVLISIMQLGAAGIIMCSPSSAKAQSLFDLFRSGQANAFAPGSTIQAPLDIMPLSLRSPAQAKAGPGKNEPKSTPSLVPNSQNNAADGKESADQDEDAEVLFENETPRLVRIALPQARPGGSVRTAAEVAPIGTARWEGRGDQLPPGVSIPGVTPPNLPLPQRVAALPSTLAAPSWTLSDAPQLRPTGLRTSETPVANMPGVFAPPEANFNCLPAGLKQALVDTAQKFGHVAILNARRPEGTGARGSYHYRCRAVDFRVRGVPVSTVYAYLKQHPSIGGRKIYPFGFFHIDDGPIRSW